MKFNYNPQTTEYNPVPVESPSYMPNILPSASLGDIYKNMKVEQTAPTTKNIAEKTYIPSLASVFRNLKFTPEDMLKTDWDNLADSQFWVGNSGKLQTNNPFFSRLMAIESHGGNLNDVSPTGAMGPFQFTQGTWKDITGNTDYHLRSDPREAAKAIIALTNRNIKILKAAGLPINAGSVYLAHNQGPYGAKLILNNLDNPLNTVQGLNFRNILVNLPSNLRAKYTANPELLTGQIFYDLFADKFKE